MFNHVNNLSLSPFTAKQGDSFSQKFSPTKHIPLQYDGKDVFQLSIAELVKFLAYVSLCSQAHAYYDNFSVFTFSCWFFSSASTPSEASAQCFNFLFLKEGNSFSGILKLYVK
jgi:hypothetical protein